MSYAVSVDDRVRNHLLVHDELGLDPEPAITHFEQQFGADRVRPVVDRVAQELRGPFHFFDAIYCINLDRETGRWDSVVRQCKALGIDHRIRRFSAVDTPSAPAIGRALSHRGVIAEAAWQDLDNVLVLEDDVVFSSRAETALGQRLAELSGSPWGLLALGAGGTPGDRRLKAEPRGVPLHAVAYHRTVYDEILRELPATPTGMARWLDGHPGLGHYYAERFGAAPFGDMTTRAPVATQSSLLPAARGSFEPLAVAS